MLDNGRINKNKAEDVNFGLMVLIMKDIGKIMEQVGKAD